MVKLGPASAMTLPASTSSAVGFVSAVVFELMPSLTSAPTVTEAVLVVLQLPALPLHCALTWVAPMAVATTIAARRERDAFIFLSTPKGEFCGADQLPESWLISPSKAVGSVL